MTEAMDNYEFKLTKKKLGNPNWKKGVAQNPAGRPKGIPNKTKKTLDRLAALGRDPIDNLIRLADQLEDLGKHDKAAEIWMEIQSYVEPKKKAVETAPEKPITPEQSKENVDEMLKLLEEASDGRQEEGSSDTSGLGDGKSTLQIETSPTDNPQEPSGE